MKKSIVKRWVKALRSGDYEQATGLLQDKKGKMCCLGVLCDITQKETGGEWNNQDGDMFFSKGINKGCETEIPFFASDILGISIIWQPQKEV